MVLLTLRQSCLAMYRSFSKSSVGIQMLMLFVGFFIWLPPVDDRDIPFFVWYSIVPHLGPILCDYRMNVNMQFPHKLKFP